MSHGMLLTVSSLLMMPFSFGKKLLGEIAEEHALTKLKRFIGQKSPGSIEGFLDVRNGRDYHHRKARSSNSAYHWNMYRKLRNSAYRENRGLTSGYFKGVIEENKADSKRMWKCIKEALSNEN